MNDETIRSVDAIEARALKSKDRDPFGFEFHEYAACLPFAKVQQFLRDDHDLTEEQWEAGRVNPTPDAMREKIRDYMEFAWDKANNRRGISANRSVAHMVAWTWMAGDDELARKLEAAVYGPLDDGDVDYCYYGKPQLVQVCEHYGIDWRSLDDDRWTNHESEEGAPADRAMEGLGMLEESTG